MSIAGSRPTLDKRTDYDKILLVAAVYSSIAGMLNCVAVFELGTPVGYTSGPCVNAGRFLAMNDDKAKGIIGVCTMFYIGGILAGLGGNTCDGDHVFEGRTSPGMLVSSAMLVLGMVLKKKFNLNFLAMQIWALSQGLMNGITSRFSSVPMRATHTAGGQTDSAITVAQAMMAKWNGTAIPNLRKVYLNLVCVIGMMSGGFIGGRQYKRFGMNAALMPAFILAFSATILPRLIKSPVPAAAPSSVSQAIAAAAAEDRAVKSK